MELPTYTSIWRIEKRLYKLYDFRLPMPLPVGQIAVFAAITVPYILLLTVFGLPFDHTLFWLYVLPPGVLTWLATRPVLESKRLPELITSQLRYLGEPQAWCRMAPLAEKDEITVYSRVWRRATAVAPAEAGQPHGAAALPAAAQLGVAQPGVAIAGPSAVPPPGWASGQAAPSPARRRGGSPGWPGQARRRAAQRAARGRAPGVATGRPPEGTAGRAAETSPGWPRVTAGAGAAGVAPAWPEATAGRGAGDPGGRGAAGSTGWPEMAGHQGAAVTPGWPDAPARHGGQGSPGWPDAPARHGGAGPARGGAGGAEEASGAEEAGGAEAGVRAEETGGGPSGTEPPGAGPRAVPVVVVPARRFAESTAGRDLTGGGPADGVMGPAGRGAAAAEDVAVTAGGGSEEADGAVGGGSEEADGAVGGRRPATPPGFGAAGDGRAVPGAAAGQVPLQRPRPALVPQQPPAVERVLGGPGSRRPATGWRNRVTVVPGGQGPGRPDPVKEARDRVGLPLGRPRLVVVLGCTVGAGQTVTTLLLADLLASMRDEPVAALDLNPGPASLTELAGLPAIPVSALVGPRAHTGEPAHAAPRRAPAGRGPREARTRPDVICDDPAGEGSWSAAGWAVGHGADGGPGDSAMSGPGGAVGGRPGRLFEFLASRYPLTLADPGAPAVARVLPVADQLVLVAPASPDAAGALGMTLEWLDAHGHGPLTTHSITVLNGVSHRSVPHAEQAEQVVRGRCRAIVRVPWDDHLAEPPAERGIRESLAGAGAPSRVERLRPAVLQAYTALAGVLVSSLSAAPQQRGSAAR